MYTQLNITNIPIIKYLKNQKPLFKNKGKSQKKDNNTIIMGNLHDIW